MNIGQRQIKNPSDRISKEGQMLTKDGTGEPPKLADIILQTVPF